MTALWNVFHKAVLVLVGAGAVKQRLSEAFRDHLAAVREQDVPEPLRAGVAALRAAMHAVPATGGMTSPEVSVRKMSDKEAAAHAAAILEMFATLSALAEQEAAQAKRLRVVGADERSEDVPAFLSRA